jgi:hypothetical protein
MSNNNNKIMPKSKPNTKAIPPGQPRPRPRVKFTLSSGNKSKLPIFVYPHEIVNVRSKSDLDKLLDMYSHPFPMMDGSEGLKTTHSNHHLVEWVYPALRWFCRIYGKDIPQWLHGNGWADDIPKKEYKKYFGKAPLHVIEWKEDKRSAGMRA